ncbi:ABC transporter ATP-binding protein [Candidatus Bathyarchaeota archaeon]|nr:ABC transporter ATP-binding protein [Candidatus Bathyarchaeota archaeon]
MESIIELDNIRTHFQIYKSLFKTVTVKAVDGVSLRINKGETVSIVGESGSGKTTLGRTAVKLVEPISGKLIFEGKDITHLRKNLKSFRRKAQIIFQDPFMSLNPYMTVSQIIEEPLIIHGVPREDRPSIIERALQDVRLMPVEEFKMKYPHMLSGGQRQRVGIARAIVLEPIFLVADEPVSMIDASSRAEILLLFEALQKKYKMAVMYITHDLATAKYFSDYIAVMYLGRIVEYGPTLEVLQNPIHPYTRMLIDVVPDLDPQNRFIQRNVIPGEPPSPINPPVGCGFKSRCPLGGECPNDAPQMREIAEGHMVACHRGW